jgi:MFS transporter, DHA2 family, multidrug resistance protein
MGVILGAGIVTLTGRLLSLGLADLKGNVGIGFDDGAWISSTYNIALMFIGPFSVYLGGLLGPRRVLLGSAAVFTAISAYLPLVHSYSLLLTLLALAGLTSGTFYPLTLTFALRNIPLRYLTLVIALYATCIEACVNSRLRFMDFVEIISGGDGCEIRENGGRIFIRRASRHYHPERQLCQEQHRPASV